MLEGKTSLGPWFLTFDNLVFTVSELNINRDLQKFGYAMQPRTWLNYLLTFSKMDFNEEDKNAVAEAVIIFTARTQSTKISIDEYSRLITYKLGLEGQDLELIKEIFLQSPLRAELERALEYEHGGEADRIAHEIISQGNLKDFIEEVVGVRSLKKDHARVLERLKEVDTLYHEERAARQAIERTSGNQVYIVNEVKTTVDVSIQTQINNFIPQLEALLPEGFEKYGLPEPPKGEMGTGRVKSWLIKLRDALTTTKNTTETIKGTIDNVKTLLPYISLLIGLLGQGA